MAAHVLVSGILFREPERRTSKGGKPFTTATMKVKDGEGWQWWRLVAFQDAVQAELMRLTDGDALSVQGALKAETYEKDGVTKLSLSIIADHVLALRQPSKARKAHEASRKEDRAPASRVPEFDDAVPF